MLSSMRIPLFFLVAIAACARMPGRIGSMEHCQAPTGPPLSVLDSLQRSLLVGSFRLVQINTSDKRQRATTRVTPLRLRVADSAERANARAKRIGNWPRNVEMSGTRDAMMYGYVNPVELDGTILFLGCRSCFDASSEGLALHSVSETGFKGRWLDPQSGNTRVVRSDGSFGPDPEGHFCATRVVADRR